ncbi:MAG: hypothetical protein JJU26_13420 [Oceanicaulis sp.]|nr:hypothetical protein [Oceanicaulis sp.]
MTTILDAFDDANLLGGSFPGDTRQAWRAVLAGAWALPMDRNQQRLFRTLSGGRRRPSKRVSELWCIAGRRSDKTHTAAGMAVYIATIGAEIEGTLARLSPGERGVVSIIACDRSQAKVALAYVRGLLDGSPILASMVEKASTEGVELSNGVSIEVATNSHRAVRGRTMLAAILDECAFYRDETSATPDVELYRALVPSLATTGGLLVGISSPYARRGLLYDKWKRHHGKDGDVLVVQGGTRVFNPTVPVKVIRDAERDDPDAAKAEWGGEFRQDVEAFLSREVVEGAVRPEPIEIPRAEGIRYCAFLDPTGGGKDEFTLAIGHEDDGRTVVDLLRARRGKPADIVAEYAPLLKAYGVTKATSDRYAGSWPADEFQRHGIKVEQAAAPKSDLYRDALAAFNSGQVEIPPDDRLITQLTSLERRTARGGRDSIDHPPGGHDDRANAVAGLLAVVAKPRPRFVFAIGESDRASDSGKCTIFGDVVTFQ